MRQPLLWANLVGSLAAVVGNVWAARVGQSEHRTMRYSVATIAALFAALYIGDLTGLLGPDLRSEIAAGIAPVAWLVAWTAPAVRSATVHRGTVDIIRTMSARVTDSCPVPEDSGDHYGWR